VIVIIYIGLKKSRQSKRWAEAFWLAGNILRLYFGVVCGEGLFGYVIVWLLNNKKCTR